MTLDKLSNLLKEPVGPKWYEFGEAVGIPELVLDSIASTTFPQNCIVEVFDYWLKYYDGKLTWRKVAYALKDIGFEHLALNIVQVYKTGNYIKG